MPKAPTKPPKLTGIAVGEREAKDAAAYLLSVRADLVAQCGETITQDEQLLTDMLDGEGGDALDILRAVLASAENAAWYAEATKERRAVLKQREEAHQARSDRLRGIIAEALRRLGLQSLQGADATLFLREGGQHLEVPDESAVPEQFRIPQPDKIDRRAITEHLKAQATAEFPIRVNFAVLVQSPSTHQVRRA